MQRKNHRQSHQGPCATRYDPGAQATHVLYVIFFCPGADREELPEDYRLWTLLKIHRWPSSSNQGWDRTAVWMFVTLGNTTSNCLVIVCYNQSQVISDLAKMGLQLITYKL